MKDYMKPQTTGKIRSNYLLRTEHFGDRILTYGDPALSQLMIDGLMPLKKPFKKLKALDLACGQGDGSVFLKKLGVDVFYMDITETMIQRGIEKGNIPDDDSRIIVGNIRDLSRFDDESFDIVLQRYAFHDMQDGTALLKSINRILKMGGKAQITDMCVDDDIYPGNLDDALDLYNTYHGSKVKGEPVQVWIPGKSQLYDMFASAELSIKAEAWYTSKVKSTHWLQEGQINEDRLKFLNEFFLRRSAEVPELKSYFNIRQDGDAVLIDFPVIVLTGQKTS